MPNTLCSDSALPGFVRAARLVYQTEPNSAGLSLRILPSIFGSSLWRVSRYRGWEARCCAAHNADDYREFPSVAAAYEFCLVRWSAFLPEELK